MKKVFLLILSVFVFGMFRTCECGDVLEGFQERLAALGHEYDDLSARFEEIKHLGGEVVVPDPVGGQVVKPVYDLAELEEAKEEAEEEGDAASAIQRWYRSFGSGGVEDEGLSEVDSDGPDLEEAVEEVAEELNEAADKREAAVVDPRLAWRLPALRAKREREEAQATSFKDLAKRKRDFRTREELEEGLRALSDDLSLGEPGVEDTYNAFEERLLGAWDRYEELKRRSAERHGVSTASPETATEYARQEKVIKRRGVIVRRELERLSEMIEAGAFPRGEEHNLWTEVDNLWGGLEDSGRPKEKADAKDTFERTLRAKHSEWALSRSRPASR
ncbi:hypothetical protein HN446_05265 [bacterium]|nr:hypothetical protein [bacterium]